MNCPLPRARSRQLFSMLVAVGGAFALAGCGPVGGFGGGPVTPRGDVPVAPVDASQAGNPDAIGSGPTRIALILPITQASGASAVGLSLRRAAELAYADSGGNDVTFLVKDDRSTPDGAREAAQAAAAEGAEVYLGLPFIAFRAPISVRRASRAARANPSSPSPRIRAPPRAASICCRFSSRTMSTGSSITPLPAARRASPPSFRRMITGASPRRSFRRSPRAGACA